MDIELDGEAKAIYIEWPQREGVEPTHRLTVEHLPDNDELVVVVTTGDADPECIWSSIGDPQ